MFCVTLWGGILRTLMLIISGAFITVIVWRVGFHVIDDKIREVLNMVPKHNQDHVVICNWTPKIPRVIKEIRSPAIQDKQRIIIVVQRNGKLKSEIESLRIQYDDVHIRNGDPTDGDTLISDTVDILKAHAVLILADDGNPNEADLKSMKILYSIKAQMKNGEDKPTIAVELLDPTLRKAVEKAGADSIVCYPDLTHKLLAQAVITPDAVDFVQRILTATTDSNEVYSLKIPKGYAGYKFCDFAKEIMTKCGSTSNPLLVVGVERKGLLHINPKASRERPWNTKKFFRLKAGDKAVVLAWKQPKDLPRPSKKPRKKSAVFAKRKTKALLPTLAASKKPKVPSIRKIEDLPPKQERLTRLEDETTSPPSAL
jgi:Trk K+ transport system NAD-binding subunit